MPTKGKILVIRGGAIGDFVLTLPVLAALRRQFPDVHLELLGYPHIAGLALAGALVDRVQAIEARALSVFFARHGELPESQRDYFSEFDLIISFLYDPDGIFRENLARCSPAQFIAGPHRPDMLEGIHASRVFLGPLTRLGIFDADPVPRLNLVGTHSAVAQSSPAPAVFGNAAERVPRTLALHPGSGSERKNWPESNWVALLRRLGAENDLHFLLVGGEVEGERLQRLAQHLPAGRCECFQSRPLTELAARLGPCAAFVGHDSGITHLAAALGLPCLALWADTNEELWRPQGERIFVLRSPNGIGQLAVEPVWDALARLLNPKS